MSVCLRVTTSCTVKSLIKDSDVFVRQWDSKDSVSLSMQLDSKLVLVCFGPFSLVIDHDLHWYRCGVKGAILTTLHQNITMETDKKCITISSYRAAIIRVL